jgi:hypothetical protein
LHADVPTSMPTSRDLTRAPIRALGRRPAGDVFH